MDFHRRSSGSLPGCLPCCDKPTSYKRVSYKSFKGFPTSQSMPETINPSYFGRMLSFSSAKNAIPRAKQSLTNLTTNARNKMKDSASISKLRSIRDKVIF